MHDPQGLRDPHRAQRCPRLRFRGGGPVRTALFLQRAGVATTLSPSTHRLLLLQLIAVIVFATLPACASRATRVPMPSHEVIAGILQAGRQAAAQGQFDRAINLFRRVQEGYPSAPQRPEATVLPAQTLEREQEIAAAPTQDPRLVAGYPPSPPNVLAPPEIPGPER